MKKNLVPVIYDRDAVLSYAEKWAYARNPAFYDFENIGGDCTNFASQCLYAGCPVMNFTPVVGWYYLSLNNRSPSWTGVKYFYNFLTENNGVGPYAEETDISMLMPGDFVQLYRGGTYTHTLVVTKIQGFRVYISSHTLDSYNRPLSSYEASGMRFIHILGGRTLK